MRGYVFINGFGLIHFEGIEQNLLDDQDPQWRGKIKYPDGVMSMDGESWVEYDYWFDESRIFRNKNLAIIFIMIFAKNKPEMKFNFDVKLALVLALYITSIYSWLL